MALVVALYISRLAPDPLRDHKAVAKVDNTSKNKTYLTVMVLSVNEKSHGPPYAVGGGGYTTVTICAGHAQSSGWEKLFNIDIDMLLQCFPTCTLGLPNVEEGGGTKTSRLNIIFRALRHQLDRRGHRFKITHIYL